MQVGSPQEDILRISGLRVSFHTYAGEVKALDGVDLTVKKGELLGLVGESGCGKSVTSLAIVGLLPQNSEIQEGEVVLGGKDLLKMKGEEIRRSRQRDLAIVFQDPMTYLNPVLTVGSQITEIVERDPGPFVPLLVRFRLDQIESESSSGGITDELREERERLEAAEKTNRLGGRDVDRITRLYALATLRAVRLPDPEKIMKSFPYELSGGMRQRAMIAMALLRKPKLLLADEMTTALDVTVQAQILKLLRELKDELDASILLITHDLAVVAEVCDRVAVMYAGNIVEVAPVEELFKNPLHPYTQGLLASIPRMDKAADDQASIKGSVPDLIRPPSGCRFHPRCPKAFSRCPQEKPGPVEITPGHFVSCFLYEK